MKKIVSLVLAMIMILSSPVQSMAWSPNGGTDNRLEGDSNQMYEPGQQDAYPTGLLPDKMIRVDVKDINMFTQATPMFENARPLSEEYDHAWDTYSTNYFYNLSTDEEKEILWDALDEVCRGFLATTADAIAWEYGGTTYYHTGFMDVEGWTNDELHEFVQIFRTNNPQYYFLNNMFISGGEGTSMTFSLGIYEAFADGDARATATADFGEQVDAWKAELADCETEEETMLEIHRLICEKVDYNEAIYGDYDEEVEFTQSAYSVMCMDLTVCAGYAEAVALMCNAMGIDALCVTSYNHQWNKVRIEDQWYNVDATWDDQSYGIDYEFYLRSDDYYDNAAAQAESHEEELFWEEYLPICSLDSNPTSDGYLYEIPGTLPNISMTVERPTIEVTEVAEEYQVRIYSEIDGAVIYYTLDGTTPSVAFTKSIYGGELVNITVTSTEEVDKIRAIAVLDGFYDSEITTSENAPEPNVPNVDISQIGQNGRIIEVAWAQNMNVDGYYVYRKTTGDWERVATMERNDIFWYFDSDVESGVKYYYYVTGYVGSREGDTASKDAWCYYLDIPEIETVVQNENIVTLSWNEIAGAESYELQVIANNIGWIDVAEISATTYDHDISTLPIQVNKGDTLVYRIIVWNHTMEAYMYDDVLNVTIVFGEEPTIENPFIDVPEDAYYYEPVLWAYENNITSGYTPTEFGTNGTCTRGEIVTFLWRAMGRPEPTTTENPFTDVPEGIYYEKAVLWAYENGITSGLTETTFGPDKGCTREQIVTFLWRAMGRQEPTIAEHSFADVADGEYYTKAVLWAKENGITSGLTATMFGTGRTCIRADVVSFLYRTLVD